MRPPQYRSTYVLHADARIVRTIRAILPYVVSVDGIAIAQGGVASPHGGTHWRHFGDTPPSSAIAKVEEVAHTLIAVMSKEYRT